MNTQLAVMDSQELDTIQRVGKMLAASGYFDGTGDSPQAIAKMATKIMAGREMGFGPFASVNGVHIIGGKPSIGANLMASAVKGSGRYDYRVKEMTSEKCAIEFFERIGDKRESIGVSEFTKADAEAAEVITNKMWKKYPKNMLFARALSNGVRWYTPDVFSGNAVYVPEELGADVDGDGNVVEAAYVVTAPTETLPQVDTPTGETVEPDPKETEISEMEKDVDLWEPNGGKPPVAAQEHESPPHQRLFGQLSSGFGTDAEAVRPWLIGKWSEKATPANTRNSATELSDDEKDALADYIKEHLTTLQRVWANHKAQSTSGVKEKVAA